MSAFLVSAATVATAEIGDKTQLLALFLVSRYKKPTAIILGMLFATIANHAGAAFLGQWLASLLAGPHFNLLLASAFLLTGLWLLIPDSQDEVRPSKLETHGVFVLTLCLFFLAEIGDKTQIATSLLAAKYQSVFTVTLGTTCGMLLANVPVIVFGKQLTDQIPGSMIRLASALIFIGIAIYMII